MFDSCLGHSVPGRLESHRPSEAPSTFVAMRSGRLPTRPFAPEDDWFVEAGGGRSPAANDETELRETRQPAPGEGGLRPAIRDREGERSRKLIAGSIVGAVILLVAGALAGALVSRSLTGGVETTTSLVTTTATLTTTLTTSTTPSTTPTTTTPSTSTTPATLPEGVVLRRGAKGAEVRQVQEALVALGYSTTIDGKFGPATAQAVKSFQTSSGLPDDGVVGPATLAALSTAVNGT
jgi:Putative peptidoglycan binding domain